MIRHAEPDYPGGVSMCLGRKYDLPLSANGLKQSRELGNAFSGIELEKVYHSPLIRAKQTAMGLASGRCPIVELSDFIEMDGGEWDGLTLEQIRSDRYTSMVPPGGETDESGLSRCLNALERISLESRGDVAIVGHSGINRILLCALMNMPLSQKRSIQQSYACVSILAKQAGKWRILELSLTLEQWQNRHRN
ncbi:MAG: histidine phosphatase family protein [Clostridia bacterium]|nr:histidine phosphatase family protein [Clostridia bacterium]